MQLQFLRLFVAAPTFHLAGKGISGHSSRMKSHEVLRDVFQSANPKLVAEQLSLSLSTVYKWAEPAADGGSGALNPLDRTAELIRATNDVRIVQWICESAGGFFVANPNRKRGNAFTLVPATNSIVQEFADMLSVIATAAIDNDIS